MQRFLAKTIRCDREQLYVTRAGRTTSFWWGESISPKRANYDGNFTFNSSAKGRYIKKTLPVDSFEPNPFGLYQVHGNVYEWVEDCMRERHGYIGVPADGSAWTSAVCRNRVLRGGSFSSGPWFLRAANRDGGTSIFRFSEFGFRVARALSP